MLLKIGICKVFIPLGGIVGEDDKLGLTLPKQTVRGELKIQAKRWEP